MIRSVYLFGTIHLQALIGLFFSEPINLYFDITAFDVTKGPRSEDNTFKAFTCNTRILGVAASSLAAPFLIQLHPIGLGNSGE